MKWVKVIVLCLLTLYLPCSAFSQQTGVDPLWYYRGFNVSQEIAEMRTPNTKVFLNKDGHMTYRVYLNQVHFIDEEGKFKDIEGPIPFSSDMDCRGYTNILLEYIETTDHIWTHENGGWRGFARFNTAGIPDETIVDSVKLTLKCVNPGWAEPTTHDIYSMEIKPTPSSNCYTVWNDAENGFRYVDDFDPVLGELHTWILGDEPSDYACTQMTNLLPEDWFAIGMCDYAGGAWYSGSIGYDKGIGYIEIEEPVAITLVSFTASSDFDFVRLNWRTEFEINNLQWLIERKEENGNDYEVIGYVPGQLTKPGPTDYSYTDRDVDRGKGYYYRLTDVSTYGYKSIHTPVFVKIPTIGEAKLLVSPTMFRENLSIKIRGLSGNNGILSIFDETGRVIKTINLSGKHSPLTLNWSGQDNNGRNVKTGVYFIRLNIGGSKTETKKVVFIK